MGKCVFENSLTFFNAYIVKIWNSLKETYAYLLKNFVNSFCKINFEYENLMLILEKPIMEYDCPIFSLVLFSEREREFRNWSTFRLPSGGLPCWP